MHRGLSADRKPCHLLSVLTSTTEFPFQSTATEVRCGKETGLRTQGWEGAKPALEPVDSGTWLPNHWTILLFSLQLPAPSGRTW